MGDGESFNVGDRRLHAIRPPIYDSPTTRGLYDPNTGVYWSSDAFATPMPSPVRDADELDHEIADCEHALRRAGADHRYVPLLMTTPGIGSVLGYTIAAEHYAGQTVGKRLMGIHVVRESGARISLGQSAIRQLPLLGQIFFIDVLFALFTEKHQRAFELLSKTRVVEAERANGGSHVAANAPRTVAL